MTDRLKEARFLFRFVNLQSLAVDREMIVFSQKCVLVG